MNKVFKVIWSYATQSWVAVSELQKVKGKSASKTDKRVALTAAALGALTVSGAYAATQVTVSGVTAMSGGSQVYVETNSTRVAVGFETVANSGEWSTSVGSRANATGGSTSIGYAAISSQDSTAIGAMATAGYTATRNTAGAVTGTTKSGNQAVALGYKATASGDQSLAIGGDTRALGGASIAIGGDDLDAVSKANLNGSAATALNGGNINTAFKAISGVDLVDTANQYPGTTSSGQGAVAIGVQAVSAGHLATAVGTTSNASGMAASALGVASQADGNGSIAIGPNAVTNSTGTEGIAIGARTRVTADSAVAIANGSTATGVNAVAIANTSSATANDAIAIGNSTDASALRAAALGANATASGMDSIAIGTNTTSSGQNANAMGLSANSSGTSSFAMGTRANASGESAYAIGTDAIANNTKSIAIGSESKSSEDKTIAIGDRANASGYHGISIGAAAAASGNTSMALGDQAIASSNYSFAAGGLANATAQYATAIGANANATGEYSTALGKSANATGRMATALGINTNATGPNATAVGSNATAAGTGGLAMGVNAVAGRTGTGALNNAIAIGTNASSVGGHSSIATGTNATASNHNAIATGTDAKAQALSTIAIGQNATSANIYAVALGTNATANLDRSVALGAYSTVSAAVDTNQATIGAITYAGFAGNAPADGDVVSVGEAEGRKRQIQNVAAGQITATSTDAINGSQLYVTNSVLSTLANSVKTEFGGDAALNPNTGEITFANIGNTGKGNIHDAIAAVKENVVAGSNVVVTPVTAANGSTTYTIDAKDTTANHSAASADFLTVTAQPQANNVTNYETALTTRATDALQKAETAVQNIASPDNSVVVDKVGDTTNLKIRRGLGITLDSNGGVAVANTTLVQGAETMRFSTPRGQQNSFVKADDLARHLNSVGFKLSGEAQGGSFEDLTESAGEKQLRTGDTLSMIAGPNMKINQVRQGYEFSVAGVDVAYAGNKATVPADAESVATAKSVAEAINHAGFTLKTSAATGGEKVSGDDEVINPADTVDMTAGKNLTVKQDANGKITYATKDDVTFNTTTTNNLTVNPNGNVNMGGNTINNVGSGGDVNTNAANIGDVKKAKTEVEAGSNVNVASRTGDNGQTIYTVNAYNTTAASVSPDYISVAGKPATAANTTNYEIGLTDKAITDFTKDTQATVVSTDNTVTVKSTEKNANGTIVYDLSVNTSVPTTTLTTNKGNVETPAQPDSYVTAGNLATTINNAVASAKEKVVAGTNIASVEPQVDDATGATTFTVNAKGATASAGSDKVTVTPTAKDGNITDYAVDLSDTAKDSLNKADTAVQSFTTAVKGATVDTINQQNTVINFVDGVGTTATAKDGDITFDVKKADLTTDTAGNVTNNNAGDTFVTGDDVADAINKATELTEKTTTVVAGKNTHVQNKVDGNNTEYTVSADKSTVSVSSALTKTETPTTDATTGAVTTDYALDLSQTTKDDIKKGVDAKNIVDTEGLTFTGDSGTTTEKLLGSSVAVNGDNNITTEATADAINIKLNKDITVNSVTANTTTTNNLKVNPNGNVDMGDNQITNVASGGDVNTNAANIGDVKKAKTEVKAGTNIVDVVKTEGDNGQDIYTVNAKDTTATHAASSAEFLTVSDAQDKGNNVKNFETALTTRAVDALKAAETAVQNFKVAVNGADVQTVANGDTVKFVNGTGTTARNASGQITFDINKSTLTTDDAGNVTNNNAGDTFVTGDDVAKAINEATERTEKTTSVVKGSNTHVQSKVDGNNTEYTVSADKSTVSVSDALKMQATPTTDGTTEAVTTDYALDLSDKTKEDIKKGVDAKDIVDTKGLTFTGDSGTTSEKLLGTSVAVNGDDNITTEATADAINIKLNKDITVDSVTADTVKAGDTTINNDGVTINNGTAGNPVTLTKDGLNNGGNKITNVADGDVTADSKDAVNGSQLYTQVAASKEVVKSDDKSVTVNTTQNAAGANVYDLSVNVDGTTITKGDNGELKANTTTLTDADTDGKVDAPTNGDENKLITAGDVATAINASGFKAKANGDEGELINPGDEVDFINGSNIEITREGGKFTVATAKDVTFDSVTFGDNGPKITNNGGNINVGGQDGAPVKITNVADGDVTADSKDAVNGSQLYTQVAASKEVVKSDDKSVTVNTTQNDAGANVYDLSVNVDETTITKTPDGKLTANTTTLADADNDGKVDDLADDKKGNLITAGDVASAINASGFKAKANGDAGELINPGDEVEFINGSNIEITRDGGKFTVATAKDVTFDSVTFGDNGPKITNNGGNINVGGPNGAPVKITNVADGDVTADSKDAVNGSQLYTQVAASKEVVKSDDKSVTVNTTQNDAGANVYDLSVNVDETTITKTPDGKLTANTTTLADADNDGKVDDLADDKKGNLITAGDVATAINASGFKAKANGDEGELINPGDEVDFINGSNIEITREGGKFTVATAKDVTFDSVTFGDNGPKITNNGGNINVGGQDGAPVKITNVADGDVTADSKDAVNGSQLYTQVAASKEVVKSDDKSVTVNTTQNAAGANVYDLSVNVDGTTITKGDNGELKANTTTLTDADTDGKVDAPTNGDENKLITAGDVATAINASGFKAKANGDEGELINPGDEVDFINGSNIEITREGGKFTVATAKDVTFDSVTFGDNGPKITNNGGNINVGGQDGAPVKITNVADGDVTADSKDAVNGSQLYTQVAASKEVVKSDDKSVTVNTTQNDAGANVYDLSVNVDETTITKTPDGKLTANTTTLADADNDGKVDDLADDKKGNLITAGDVASAINASGFKAKANGDAGELINPGDEVEFINGSNIEITRDGGKFTVATAKDVTFDSVTFGDNGPKITNNGGNINVGGPNGAPVKITNVADGDVTADSKDAVNGSQLYTQVAASKEVVKSDDKSVTVNTTQNDAGANVYDLSVNVDETTITKTPDGKLTANTTTLADADNDGKVDDLADDKKGNLITAGDVATAINASGFKAKANGDEGELINPGDEVDFINGSNIEITREGGKFTVATAKDVTFDSVTFGDNGPKITNNGGNINVGGQDGAPVKITNVADGDVTADSKDAVNGSQLYTQVAASKEVVKSDDKSVTVNTTQNAAGANVYDLSVNVDGTTITKGDNGELKANTTTLTDADTDGKVDAPTNGDENKLITAGDVATAINASGFKAKANGDEGELINPGDEVDFINGSNIEITREGGKFTVATAKDVTFDSVTFGDNGPKITNNGGNINVGGQDGAPVKITNVADGDVTADSKDAVNGSQLYTQVAASKEVVKSDDKSVTVNTTQNDAGANVYDLSVNVDETTITKGDNGELKANTTTLTDADTDGKVDAPTNGDENKLITAGDVATAINASGFNVKSGGNKAAGDEADAILINPGEEVTFTAGDNLKVKRVGNEFSFETAKEVKFDSVQLGDNGPKLTNDGNNIKVGDKDGNATSITNVKSNLAPVTPADEKQPDANSAANLADKLNNAATVADVLNAGWNLQNNDTAIDTVTHNDAVNFINGRGTTVSVTANDDGTVNNIQVDSALGYVNTDANDTSTPSNTVKVFGKDDAPVQITNVASGVRNEDGTAPVGQELAEAIKNATGDILNNAVNVGDLKAATNAATTKVVEGDNIVVTPITNADGSTTYKVETAKDVKFDSVTTGNTVMNNDGVKVGDNVALNSDGLKAGDVSVTTNGLNNGGNQIKNVAAGTEDTDGVNVSQLKAAQAAATTKVEGSEGVEVAPPTTNADGSKTYTVKAKTDGTTIKVENGNISANTTQLGNNDKGVVNTPAQPNALATAGDIANAINKAGFTAKANGDAGELINPGDEVEFINGSNIEITREGGKFTVATKNDVKFNSVQLGDIGPKLSNDGDNIKVADKDGNATKITNVANGTNDSDAVNFSQLKASQEVVKSDDKSVTVVTTQDPTTKANVFDVSVNVDGTTITKDAATGAIKANTANLNDADNDGRVDAPTNGDENKLITAGEVADAVNNVSWKVESEKDTATANVATKNTYTAGNNKVKAGDTVKVNAGRNVEISGSGRNINVAVSDSPEFASVKTGDTTVSNDGVTINNGNAGQSVSLSKNGLNNGGNRITNVKAGEANTDAVNVGQLKGVANQLNNKINRNNREARAGIAGSNAAAALPQVYIPGKSMVAAAGGTFKGENALAVGYSRSSDNGKLILKLQGNANSRGDVGGGVGIGYQW